MSRFLDNARFNAPETFDFSRKPTCDVKIDPAHWIHSRLNCLWWPDSKGGVLRDIVSQQDMQPVNDPGMEHEVTNYNLGHTARGHGLNSSNKEHYRRTSNDCWRNGKSRISFFVYMKAYDVSNGYDSRILSSDSGTGTNDHHWMIGYTSAGAVRARIRTTNNVVDTAITANGTISDGDVCLLVGTYDGTFRKISVYFTDGSTATDTANNASGDLYEVKTDSVALLATANAASDANYANAGAYYAGTYSDVLTNDQCWSLVRSPYQFVIPK